MDSDTVEMDPKIHKAHMGLFGLFLTSDGKHRLDKTIVLIMSFI